MPDVSYNRRVSQTPANDKYTKLTPGYDDDSLQFDTQVHGYLQVSYCKSLDS